MKAFASSLHYLLKESSEHRLLIVPMIIAKAVLVQVGLQILLTDGMISTANSAFQKAPKSFDGVNVDVADNVHSGAVFYPAMPITQWLALFTFSQRTLSYPCNWSV